MRWSWLERVWVLSVVCVTACTSGEPSTDVSTNCGAVDGVSALEFAQDLAGDDVMVDGDEVMFGVPPQGGAPFSPFEVRVQADLDDPATRFAAVGSAVDLATEEEIGSVEQSQAFFCSNVGPHEGWFYGGEVHVRFWDVSLDELDGREVRVSVRIELEKGEIVQHSAVGTLVRETSD